MYQKFKLWQVQNSILDTRSLTYVFIVNLKIYTNRYQDVYLSRIHSNFLWLISKKPIKYCITKQIILPFEYSSSPKNSQNRQSNLFNISINSFEFQEISISVILKSNKNVSCSIWISTDLIKRSARNKKLIQKKYQFADPQGIINGNLSPLN